MNLSRTDTLSSPSKVTDSIAMSASSALKLSMRDAPAPSANSPAPFSAIESRRSRRATRSLRRFLASSSCDHSVRSMRL